MLGHLLYPRRTLVHRMNLELPPSPYADVVTLHDVVAWKFSDESSPVRAAKVELRRADAVICVSTFTAAEAVDLLGIDNPPVIPNGVHRRFFDARPLAEQVLHRMGIVGSFVLSSGGASERKNLHGLAAAWSRVHSSRPDLTLVLSGPEHPRRTRLFGGLPGVRMLGRVPSDIVPGLMASATVVVVPSLYEGFGLPALEAMAVGTPVVAADTSSLPEVVGDGGFLVPPTPDGIAQGVLHAASGDAEVAQAVLRGRRRADGFTWERSAQAHAAVWASVSAT